MKILLHFLIAILIGIISVALGDYYNSPWVAGWIGGTLLCSLASLYTE